MLQIRLLIINGTRITYNNILPYLQHLSSAINLYLINYTPRKWSNYFPPLQLETLVHNYKLCIDIKYQPTQASKSYWVHWRLYLNNRHKIEVKYTCCSDSTLLYAGGIMLISALLITTYKSTEIGILVYKAHWQETLPIFKGLTTNYSGIISTSSNQIRKSHDPLVPKSTTQWPPEPCKASYCEKHGIVDLFMMNIEINLIQKARMFLDLPTHNATI